MGVIDRLWRSRGKSPINGCKPCKCKLNDLLFVVSPNIANYVTVIENGPVVLSATKMWRGAGGARTTPLYRLFAAPNCSIATTRDNAPNVSSHGAKRRGLVADRSKVNSAENIYIVPHVRLHQKDCFQRTSLPPDFSQYTEHVLER